VVKKSQGAKGCQVLRKRGKDEGRVLRGWRVKIEALKAGRQSSDMVCKSGLDKHSRPTVIVKGRISRIMLTEVTIKNCQSIIGHQGTNKGATERFGEREPFHCNTASVKTCEAPGHREKKKGEFTAVLGGIKIEKAKGHSRERGYRGEDLAIEVRKRGATWV